MDRLFAGFCRHHTACDTDIIANIQVFQEHIILVLPNAFRMQKHLDLPGMIMYMSKG
jgi:hypothetical protein